MIVISGQKSRVPTAVYDTYSQFGAQVLSTGHGGAVSVRMTPKKITWENWLEVRDRGYNRFTGQCEHVLEKTFKKDTAKNAGPRVSKSRPQ